MNTIYVYPVGPVQQKVTKYKDVDSGIVADADSWLLGGATIRCLATRELADSTRTAAAADQPERCENCNGELSQCGPQDSDGGWCPNLKCSTSRFVSLTKK